MLHRTCWKESRFSGLLNLSSEPVPPEQLARNDKLPPPLMW